jgi:hypothetical protein
METFALVLAVTGLALAAYALTSWLARPRDPVRAHADRGIRELEAYLARLPASRG